MPPLPVIFLQKRLKMSNFAPVLVCKGKLFFFFLQENREKNAKFPSFCGEC